MIAENVQNMLDILKQNPTLYHFKRVEFFSEPEGLDEYWECHQEVIIYHFSDDSYIMKEIDLDDSMGILTYKTPMITCGISTNFQRLLNRYISSSTADFYEYKDLDQEKYFSLFNEKYNIFA